jgi:hypothetical protein
MVRRTNWKQAQEDSSWDVSIYSWGPARSVSEGIESRPTSIVLRPSGSAEVINQSIFDLNEAVSCGILGQMRNTCGTCSDPRFVTVKTPLHAGNTGDGMCLIQAASWMRTCLQSHSRCKESFGHNGSNVLPTRLLCVDGNHLRIRMAYEISSTSTPEYMTVSHRWRLRNMPKLLRSNIAAFKRSIDVLALPQTFQDAIVFARRLSIPYVWIDALCIVQDDEEDKGPEIAKMDHIY